MASPNSAIRTSDGSWDYSGGVDSSKTPLLASELNPNGLSRSQISWANNATVRGGGIQQRTGWQKLVTVGDGTALYQGGFLYEPNNADPQLFLAIGGHLLQVRVDTDNSVRDLSNEWSLFQPPSVARAYFEQIEEFLIWQAGDLLTLPIFWDGRDNNGVIGITNSLRRSNGIIGPTHIPGVDSPLNELPAAGVMRDYMGRLWYAFGRVYCAGDISGGPSGTNEYNSRDAVLRVTENPLALGGDGFSIPARAGNIRALEYAANLNTQLGEGPLFIFGQNEIWQLQVPVERASWLIANKGTPITVNGTTVTGVQPLQTVAQIGSGACGERCVVAVNGDLFYLDSSGNAWSFHQSLRNYGQWGNTPISREMIRTTSSTNRALMATAPGILFDNRLWMATLPTSTAVGPAFRGIMVMDFDIISTMSQKLPPVWEGMYEGVQILQMFTGDFGGRERAFATVVSATGAIEVWEFTTYSRTENGDNRLNWAVEFPALQWRTELLMKRLDGGEMWIDKIYGTIELVVYYRVDADPCWNLWFATQFCAARSSAEDSTNPTTYPEQTYREGYKFPIVFPTPPERCQSMNARPTTLGYYFQVRVEVHGWCRIRSCVLHAVPQTTPPFDRLSGEIISTYCNTQQTVSLTRPDGSIFTAVIPLGRYCGASQPEADNQARTAAQQAAYTEQYSSSYPVSVCGCVGGMINEPIVLSGGEAPYTWNILQALPAGLALSVQPNTAIGLISGLPTSALTSTSRILITDHRGNTLRFDITFYILQITTTVLAPFTAGVPYMQALTAVGGSGSYTWSVIAGTIPDGLTLDPAGFISGVPTGSGQMNVTLQVQDNACTTVTPTPHIILDEGGNPVLDENGNVILAED